MFNNENRHCREDSPRHHRGHGHGRGRHQCTEGMHFAGFGGGRGRGHGCSHGGAGGSDQHGRSPLFKGRKFSSDDIQLLLLHFLSEQANYGYELIKLFATRSNGFYTPSPGVIYPALTYLEEIGYVTVQAEGNRKHYALSETGREYLANNQALVEQMLAKLDHFAQKMDSVREAFNNDDPETAMLPEYLVAIRQLKHALHSSHSADEQRRIVEIVTKATTEILANKK